MSGAYLPVLPAVRDRANEWLAAMAARGFVPDLDHAVWTNGMLKTRPGDLEEANACPDCGARYSGPDYFCPECTEAYIAEGVAPHDAKAGRVGR